MICWSIRLKPFQSTLSVRRATDCKRAFKHFYKHFNPRSPWGERRYSQIHSFRLPFNFNPRSPWGERPCRIRCSRTLWHFNPRSPWGERRHGREPVVPYRAISIHALREESDYKYYHDNFQFMIISIHALREESDGERVRRRSFYIMHFNPRSPWGERPLV